MKAILPLLQQNSNVANAAGSADVSGGTTSPATLNLSNGPVLNRLTKHKMSGGLASALRLRATAHGR